MFEDACDCFGMLLLFIRPWQMVSLFTSDRSGGGTETRSLRKRHGMRWCPMQGGLWDIYNFTVRLYTGTTTYHLSSIKCG